MLLGTLVLGVNMKLFAVHRFLCFYRKRLLRNGAELSSEEQEVLQVVALNEALFFELALESLSVSTPPKSAICHRLGCLVRVGPSGIESCIAVHSKSLKAEFSALLDAEDAARGGRRDPES